MPSERGHLYDSGDPQRHGRALEWLAAYADGIADRLSDFSREHRGHWYYLPDEIPRYAPCDCGATLRVDRLDLVAEHLRQCPSLGF